MPNDSSSPEPPGAGTEPPGEVTAAVGWWLRLQLGLGLAGGVVWLTGAVLESDFTAGLGAGLLIAALVLRFGRQAAEREGDRGR